MSKRVVRPALTQYEKDFLSENYMYLNDDDLADILGISNGTTVRKIRSNLGLRRNKKVIRDFVSETPVVIWVQRELYDTDSFETLKNISI